MKKNECQVEVDTKEQLQALLTLPDGKKKNECMKKNECQVEVDTKEQLQALLTLPDGTIDFVLCDNFGPEALAEVHLIYTCMYLSLLM